MMDLSEVPGVELAAEIERRMTEQKARTRCAGVIWTERQMERLLNFAERHYHLVEGALENGGRTARLVDARHVTMVAALRLFDTTLVEVGRVFRKNHATVIYARERLERRPELQRELVRFVAAWMAEVGEEESAFASGDPFTK